MSEGMFFRDEHGKEFPIAEAIGIPKEGVILIKLKPGVPVRADEMRMMEINLSHSLRREVYVLPYGVDEVKAIYR